MGTSSPASPLRYPGGKQCLAPFVKQLVHDNEMDGCIYAEPYAGGAGLALRLLMDGVVRNVLLNDKCSALITFWRELFENTESLLRLVADTPITMDVWHHTRNVMSQPQDFSPLEVAYALFFQNRTNFSGVINGGVIGGKSQSGKYKLDARYPKIRLLTLMQKVAELRDYVRLYNEDALDFLRKRVSRHQNRALVYCDPPYYVKGQGLYLNAYKPIDHKSLADYLHSQDRMRWFVTYDNVIEIADLYADNCPLCFKLPYSAHQVRKGKELLILSSRLKMSDTAKQKIILSPDAICYSAKNQRGIQN